MKSKNGFTLTEILGVIAIIAVFVSIAIPSIILVKNRINKKAYDSKKEFILLSAESYGQDNLDNSGIWDENGEALITVGSLLSNGYLEKDVDNTNPICSSAYGCIIDPRDKTNMNNFTILIKNTNNNVNVTWQGLQGAATSRILVNAVLAKLNCTPTSTSPCLYPEDAMDNYLTYSKITWRILGVYRIGSEDVVKLITNDTINID